MNRQQQNIEQAMQEQVQGLDQVRGLERHAQRWRELAVRRRC